MIEPRSSPERRRVVAERANGCCEYCRSQARFSPDPFSVEHIIPRARDGSDDFENLALSCQGCNNRKYVSVRSVDPVTGQNVQLFNPRRQRWTDHFAWNEDFTIMIGITATGRATVDRLQLNREGVVNLRHILSTIEEHPPANPIDE